MEGQPSQKKGQMGSRQYIYISIYLYICIYTHLQIIYVSYTPQSLSLLLAIPNTETAEISA